MGGRADVRALLRETRVNARALDAEEDEHRDEHRRADLLEDAGRQIAAVEILAKKSSLKAKMAMTMKEQGSG